MTNDSLTPEVMLCPNCEKDTVGTYVADSSFKYGVENPITLVAKEVLHFHCTECHLDFTGEDGENKRTSAVIDHLTRRIAELEKRNLELTNQLLETGGELGKCQENRSKNLQTIKRLQQSTETRDASVPMTLVSRLFNAICFSNPDWVVSRADVCDPIRDALAGLAPPPPVETAGLQSHAKWLRQAAEEISKEGHAGWGNTCAFAADAIERASVPPTPVLTSTGHEDAQHQIAMAVHVIQSICGEWGYDPCEWLNDQTAIEDPTPKRWHCNICGGDVSLVSATAPTAKIGPGGKRSVEPGEDHG